MKITNKNIWTIIACIALSLLLFLINYFGIEHIVNDSVRILLSTMVSTIITVLLANVAWEVIAKKNFAQSLLNMVKLSENIANSGIDSVYVDFRNINWTEELSKTSSFVAAFTYAYSWRSANQVAIEKFAQKKKKREKMFIIMPDPERPNITADLDRRFGYEAGETKKRIEDAIQYYKKIGVTVYVYSGTLQASYYKMDNSAVMSFFTHSKEKTTVPAIQAAKGGHLYDYIRKDLDEMMRQSDIIESIEIKIDENGRRSVVIGRAVK